MTNTQKTGQSLNKNQNSSRVRSHEAIQVATEDQIRYYMDHLSNNTSKMTSGKRVKAMKPPQSDYIQYPGYRTSKDIMSSKNRSSKMPSHMTSKMSQMRKSK